MTQTHNCNCTMTQHILGDGCSICQPKDEFGATINMSPNVIHSIDAKIHNDIAFKKLSRKYVANFDYTMCGKEVNQTVVVSAVSYDTALAIIDKLFCVVLTCMNIDVLRSDTYNNYDLGTKPYKIIRKNSNSTFTMTEHN